MTRNRRAMRDLSDLIGEGIMAEEYWYNLGTGEVEVGPQSGWQQRMGPYDSREEAERALQTARERNERFDAEDDD